MSQYVFSAAGLADWLAAASVWRYVQSESARIVVVSVLITIFVGQDWFCRMFCLVCRSPVFHSFCRISAGQDWFWASQGFSWGFVLYFSIRLFGHSRWVAM